MNTFLTPTDLWYWGDGNGSGLPLPPLQFLPGLTLKMQPISATNAAAVQPPIITIISLSLTYWGHTDPWMPHWAVGLTWIPPSLPPPPLSCVGSLPHHLHCSQMCFSCDPQGDGQAEDLRGAGGGRERSDVTLAATRHSNHHFLASSASSAAAVASFACC